MNTVYKRDVYRHADLQRVLNPRSIAIVGASSRAGAFGARSLDNLRDYTGKLYLVNARYKDIDGRRCYASINQLPEPPDCVLIATPQEHVEGIVTECAAYGAGGVIIFASGYGETGTDAGVAAQNRLTEIARGSGLRIVGPNCIGFANYSTNALISFAAVPRPTIATSSAPAIGLVSQSGALSFALGQAQEHGTSFSHIFSSGNACDIDVADQVAFLAEEPSCKAIACVFEGMSDPTRLIQAANIAAEHNKPVVLYKMARSSSGASAAMSHTGSIAGSNAAYQAAFDKAGIVTVDTLESLIETTVFFAKAGQPAARGVAVVATSGGASVIAADESERHGVELPQPHDETTRILLEHIPDFGSARNPCDVTAQVANNPESLYACAEALFKDSHYGAVIVPIIYAYAFSTERIEIFNRLAEKYGKVACVTWLTEFLEGPGAEETEASPNVALFRSTSRCFAAIAAWHQRADWLATMAQNDGDVTEEPARAGRVSNMLNEFNGPVLTEREAKQLLHEYEVPVVPDKLVTSAAEAVATAEGFGYPVVMKVESPDIPHKTEAGVIKLDLRNADDVRAAFELIMLNANAQVPRPRINGVLVQPQLEQGVEIMVGGRVDPQFGPMIVVSSGGVLVELIQDSVAALAPVSPKAALRMIQRLKGKALLTGFRSSQPVNIERLAVVISQLSLFAWEQRERLSEFDVNPLICSGDSIVAVDALISLNESHVV